MQTLDQECKSVGDSAYWGGRGDWLIVLAVHRDSDCLARSNFEVAREHLNALPAVKDWPGEFNPVSVERFNHWAVGWVDYLLVDPECKEAVKEAEAVQEKLNDYPVLNEEHYSNLEQEEASDVWRDCFRESERIAYIRKHRSQFDFASFGDLLGCVRGKHFAGYACELLN